MPTGTFQYHNEQERLAIEAAIAHVREIHQLAQDAPAGQVLSLCEQTALQEGRAMIRHNLGQALQARVDRDQKKGGRLDDARCATAASVSNETPVPRNS